MFCRLAAVAALTAALIVPKAALAEANIVRVAKQFGIGYMQYMVMQELKLVEKHAKAAGLDVTTEWATFRSSDVMNDALISGSVDFVSLGVPGIITIYSKTKGTASEVKGVLGLNVSPLMLLVRDPAIKSLKDFKDTHRIALPAVKVSNQAIILQMAAAKEFGEAKYNALDHLTVSMSHPDATAAMLGGQCSIRGRPGQGAWRELRRLPCSSPVPIGRLLPTRLTAQHGRGHLRIVNQRECAPTMGYLGVVLIAGELFGCELPVGVDHPPRACRAQLDSVRVPVQSSVQEVFGVA